MEDMTMKFVKFLCEELLVAVSFFTIGSLIAIPNISDGIFVYKDIVGDLLLGSFVAMGFWWFMNSEE